MINGIAHSAVKVVDVLKSLAFYCDALGLEKAFEIEDDSGRPWIVYLKIGNGQFIELFYGGVPEPANAYAPDLIGYHHFCIETDDINEVAKKLHALGIIDKPEPNRGQDLNYNLWIHNPDGNAVEIVQYDPESFHMKKQ